MTYINQRVSGVPYGKEKSRGDKEAPSRWTEAVKKQTEHLPRVKEACTLKATFLLPPDKFPSDLPYGSDLDNVLRPFLDALNHTVFAETKGHDSCVISMTVMKTRFDSNDKAGVHFEVLPVRMP